MIYEQRTWVRFNDEDKWYSYSFGLYDGSDSYKKYVYLKDDEAVAEKTFECNVETFVNAVKDANTDFEYASKFLFLKEHIIWKSWDKHKVWNVEDIKKIEVKVTQRKVDMTLSETEMYLDAEEYFKMLKDNGVKI